MLMGIAPLGSRSTAPAFATTAAKASTATSTGSSIGQVRASPQVEL